MFLPFLTTLPIRIRGNLKPLIKRGAKLVVTWEDIWEDKFDLR